MTMISRSAALQLAQAKVNELASAAGDDFALMPNETREVDQVGGVFFHGFLLLGRFLLQHVGAQDDVGLGRGVVRQFFFAFVVGERQHVGGVVLAAVFAVEGLAFGGVDKTDRQFCRREQ